MTKSLNHERELSFQPGHRFRASVFEVDASASDQHFVIRAVGQVDDFRGHLSGEAKQICSPRPFRHDLPSLPSTDCLRSFVDVRAHLPAEGGVDLRHIVKATPNTANCPAASEAPKRHVDSPPAGNVEKILRGEGLSLASPLAP